LTKYADEIARLVTAECANGTSHRKVLEPLANMVASVLAGIDVEHGVDDRLLFSSQVDKFFNEYRNAYLSQGIDNASTSTH
jgi:hypothetical protein